jgi:hypothetical protein
MTPKEKARELTNFMYDVDIKEDSEFKPLMKWSYAKRCALIAVDEMIQQFTNKCCESANIRYWQEVKQEIQVL